MRRMLESDTRMKYLLGNNPLGEGIKIIQRICKKYDTNQRSKPSVN